AFGWDVSRVDGHDVSALVALLSGLKARSSAKPHVVLAATVKGKGVSFMEGKAEWHGKAPNEGQLEAALAELVAKEACNG
ncbi:MAG: transketolase, partial [Eggerthellaceae bacterium]|nr:transketolase [Eggerthellaceae bacterium]